MILRYGLFLLALLAFVPKATSQNVTGYGVMPDPFLFLLREPAVQQDLGLTSTQKQRLIELNESLDGVLLAGRNTKRNAQQAQQNTADAFKKSREVVQELFTKPQQDRLRQIAYRLKGMPFVLEAQAASDLGLSAEQKASIEKIVSETREKLKKVETREFPGEEAQKEAQRTATAARREQQEDILAVLDNRQKQKIASLVGKNFDPSSLGRVAFKAPELIESGQWINSPGLELSDLRGKVVALHFFAFG